MKNELLKYQQFNNASEANVALQIWRNQYNTERPHAALNMQTPAEVYTPSKRQIPQVIEKFEYGGQFHVIKVNSWGYARFAHHQVYLSETFERVNTWNFAQIKTAQRFTPAIATL